MSLPLVSAIILNYRSSRDAWRCARGLLEQTMVKDMEICIVDNHSDDESIGYLRNNVRNEPRVTILENPANSGYGQGNNFGIGRTSGTYTLIINPDNILERDGLEKMVHAMQNDPKIGIVAPQLVQEDGTVRESVRSFPTPMDVLIKRSPFKRFFLQRIHRYLQHAKDPTLVRDVDWVAGACMLIRRDVYEELQGFDPRFFLFFEDTDLCRRCWALGKRVVYYPLVKATDRKERLSEGGFFSLFTKKTVRIHLQSALKYFWKWRYEGKQG